MTLLAMLLLGCAAVGAGGPRPASASTGPGPGDVQLAAQDLEFDRSELVVPAGRQFTLVFENRDWTPHNVSIAGPAGLVRFSGEIFGGVATRRYPVPALEAGRYRFRCDVHTGMSGELVAAP